MLSTDKQTNRQTNATKNITSFAKEVIMLVFLNAVRLYGKKKLKKIKKNIK